MSPTNLGQSFAAGSEIDVAMEGLGHSKTQVFYAKKTGSVTSMSLNQQGYDNFNNDQYESRQSLYSQQNDLDSKESFVNASSLEARMNGFSIPHAARKAVGASIAKGLM